MLCDAEGCSKKATYVLVDYNHNPIRDDDERIADGGYFCDDHAFVDKRESCHICVAAKLITKTYDEETGGDIDLLRTYPLGTLDDENCCSDHP